MSHPTDRESGGSEEHRTAIVVRDKRNTGPAHRPRRPAGDPGAGPVESPPPPADQSPPARLAAELAERTEDLLRVKAEYDNYRKRVKRDRLAIREIAVANVLRGLLPVLDAVDGARELGELTGGFEAVTRTLEAQLAALGLRSFGEVGDSFDPTVHEAVAHSTSGGVGFAVCSAVLRPGYRIGEQLLRPAEVVVESRGGEDVKRG